MRHVPEMSYNIELQRARHCHWWEVSPVYIDASIQTQHKTNKATMTNDECHLAICCGPIVTTWNCRSDAGGETKASSFSPRSSDKHTPVVDVSWNSSGQGMFRLLVQTH